MPKLGMEPIRRDALVKATIHEIGQKGSLDVTVSQIAKRAGVSSALAHHYFGAKDQIFLAAMRHILTTYSAQVRAALMGAETPRDRVQAIVGASFEAGQFRREVISAWLNFYVQAQTSEDAGRLLRIYQKRLRSNLAHALRPVLADPSSRAETLAALIDGLYIRAGLSGAAPDGKAATQTVMAHVDLMLGATP